jgi:hypothetical protein
MVPAVGFAMARKRYSDEDFLGILRQVEVELASGADLATAIISNYLSSPFIATYTRVGARLQ